MRCKLCHHPIHIKRTFINLFDEVPYDICHHCFKAHENIYPYFVVPSQGGMIHIFEILTHIDGEPGYYFQYIKPYLLAYLKERSTIPLIYLDTLDENLLSMINQLNIDLIILTLKYKEE